MATAPRKKSARLSADERSAQIADAARAIALEAGLSAVTLRAIAARIDVAPALVAHYRPNMDRLVADTFRAITAAELAEVTRLTSHGTARERMRALIATALDLIRDDVTAVWVDAWSLGRRNAALAAAVGEVADGWEAQAASIIRDGIAAGEFGDVDADAVAWLLVGIFDGLNAQSVVHSRHDPERIRIIQRALARELGLPDDALAD